MFYDIDGQINNLYSMHTRASQQVYNSSAVKDMSNNDLELIRERIVLLRDKGEALSRTFQEPDIFSSLTAER